MKVTVDHPAFPDGHSFYIEGLGEFKNGEERELSKEEMDTYEAAYERTVADTLSGGHFTVDGKQLEENTPAEETVSPDEMEMTEVSDEKVEQVLNDEQEGGDS